MTAFPPNCDFHPRDLSVRFAEGFRTPALCRRAVLDAGPAFESLVRRKPRGGRGAVWLGGTYGDLKVADGFRPLRRVGRSRGQSFRPSRAPGFAQSSTNHARKYVVPSRPATADKSRSEPSLTGGSLSKGRVRSLFPERSLLCRFLDGGMTRGASHSGGRRPKSAKARSRGKLGSGCAVSAMGI